VREIEISIGKLTDVHLNLMPAAFIIANLFTVGTNRDHTFQRLNATEGLLQLGNEFFLGVVGLL
jgi:hypothetical protein